MIGLPGETDVDVVGIAETVRWLRRECANISSKRLNFNITISNFTPKPHTPFQWHSVSTSEFLRKQDLLREEFRRIRGVKVNYTDVRISAMEDFVGRGDRRLAPVVKRAWELGAGMDSWWESLDNAFAAWETAIAEAGLTWKYRQVENGEWNIFLDSKTEVETDRESFQDSATEELTTEELITRELATQNLDAPLPWDHINTGIDKNWLKNDLEKALAAATVPDCAFEGCSHCGICGTDFGHNIVMDVPPIPEFVGHLKPEITRKQRLRVWFGKHGEMRLLSHLDLVRLFDRSIRRASIPISFTGGFHPGPRIAIANALSLGITSSGEIADFELKADMETEEFKAKLEAQLPSEIPIYRVEEVDIESPAATQILARAEYSVTISATDSDSNQPCSSEKWQQWIEAINNSSEILWKKTTKRGRIQEVNLCDRLFELEIKSIQPDNSAVLRFLGSCRNDGTKISPDNIVYMLEKVGDREFELLDVHRQQLILE